MPFIILFFALISMPAHSAEIESFSTDFCTGFPEGTHRSPGIWKNCCLEHDLYFWAGGNKKQRQQADVRLRDCVASVGEKRISKIIYAGIRLGSLSPFKLQGKWGNGWGDERESYLELTTSERQIAMESILHTNIEIEENILNKFIFSLAND